MKATNENTSIFQRKIIPSTTTQWKDLLAKNELGETFFEFSDLYRDGRRKSTEKFSNLKALNEDRLNDREFCDFTIITGLQHFPVHQCLVGVASEFFKKAITTEMKKKYESSVTVHNIKPETMELVLNDIYGEDTCITNGNVDELFRASTFLGIFSLNSACVMYDT